MLSFIRKHPIGVGSGAVLAVLGLAWLAFGYFGVHTLFFDDVVDEAAPVFDASPVAFETDGTAETTPTEVTSGPATTAPTTDPTTVPITTTGSDATATPTATPPPTTDAPAAPPQIVTEYQGVFESDAHPTAGTAVVLGNGTGQRFLRFEDFETDNGPDLNVYLVNSSTGDVSDYVDLGDLKGNIGEQNYEIPADVDLDVYDEVVIWCVRFGVGFGDARLAPT